MSGKGLWETVKLINGYSSSGHENEGEFSSFWEWFRHADRRNDQLSQLAPGSSPLGARLRISSTSSNLEFVKRMKQDLANLSRLVSHALRHEPWLYELEIDDEGWTDLDSLVDRLRGQSPEWANLTSDDVMEMIKVSPKQRHEIVDGRIRALYGHSLPFRIRRLPCAPPRLLFHGTSPGALANILEVGLLPMNRQYVHMSTDRETAIAVGSRKSRDPRILRISALEAFEKGVAFYEGNEKVWLADRVPPGFFRLDMSE